MNQPVQPSSTLNLPTSTATSSKYLDLARKIKEIEAVKGGQRLLLVALTTVFYRKTPSWQLN